MNSCSCLTLIVACIVYWQAKEIARVVNECDPKGSGIDVSLLEARQPHRVGQCRALRHVCPESEARSPFGETSLACIFASIWAVP